MKKHLCGRWVVFCVVFLCISMIALKMPAAAAGSGVVIYKGQPLVDDMYADVTEYRKFDQFSTVTNVTELTGNVLILTNPQVMRIVPYPNTNIISTVLRESDLAPLNATIGNLSALIQKYPRSGKFLRPHIVLFRSEIGRFQAGQVKFEGRWLPNAKVAEDIVAARKSEVDRKEAAERKRAESLRLEAEKVREQQQAEMTAAEKAKEEQVRVAAEAEKKAREVEKQQVEARQALEQKKLEVVRQDAERRESERLQAEQLAEKENQERELLLYVRERFKRVDRFTNDLTTPVMAR